MPMALRNQAPLAVSWATGPIPIFVPNMGIDSFLSPTDTPYDPAPAHPPGPALLDDNESNMLDNFFTTMNSNHLADDFWQRGQQNKPLDVFNFDWSDELPPTFEGSTTSLSQPTYPHRKSNGGTMPHDQGTSSDILAAASMLYQNGMTVFGHHPFSGSGFPGLNGGNHALHDKNIQPGSGGAGKDSGIGIPRSRLPTGFHTSEMLFDVHEPVPIDRQPNKARTLHWGSDISFMDQGYIAPPDQPDVEQRTKELLDHLDCFEPQSSAANTRAPSPDHLGNNTRWPGQEPNGSPTAYRGGLDDGMQPKKRPRTLIKEEDDDEVSEIDLLRSRFRRPRSSFSKAGRVSSDTTSRKSRLQQNAKPARENLTEEQKRTNHILSEQKRRNLIRQGFDEMCSLVPGLRGGGFSKSAMLTQAADWLEDVLQGNEILKGQLAELKAVNGLVMPR